MKKLLAVWQHLVAALLSCWLLVAPCAAGAHGAVSVGGSRARVDVSAALEILEDQAGALEFDQVRRSQASFGKHIGATLPSHSIFWGRLVLDRQPGEPGGFLAMDPTLVGRIDVFSQKADGTFRVATVDEETPLNKRSSGMRGLVFQLENPTTASQVVYVRFEPRGNPLQSQLRWVSEQSMPREASDAQFAQGLLYGALLALVAYNLFLWYATRDASYALYVYYLCSFCALMAMLTGTRPGWMPGATLEVILLLNCAVIHGGVTFFNFFLDLKKHRPSLARTFRALQWVVIGLALSTVTLGPNLVTSVLSLLLIGVAETALIIVSLARWRQGFEPAKFSFVGLVVHAAVTTLFVAQLLGLVSIPGLSIYAVELAAVWEGLLFSFALAYRVRLAEEARSTLMAKQELLLASEQRALASANEATREKNIVLSMISHELRSPLQSMVAAIDVQRGKPLSEGFSDFLRKMDRAAARIGSQLRDLFILSVEDVARLEMRPEPFEVRELVEAVVQGIEAQFEVKALTVHIVGPDELFVVADPTRVEQVVSNLVENAFKYTNRGFVQVRFDFTAGKLLFEISDSGSGIAPVHQRELFVPYRRFGSVERERTSSGIGLAVVKKLVTHLGGSVDVSSELGKGSTFSAAIPVELATLPAEAEADENAVSMLIVDDRPDVLEGLCALARDLGYHCRSASNAAIAANLVAAQAFDFVLLDLDMPAKSGAELASEIRRGGGPSASAVLVSISAGTGETNDAQEQETGWAFDLSLRKPIDRVALKRLVDSGASNC